MRIRSNLPRQAVPIVILAGGLGTRLGSENIVPKPMVMVGDRPLLWHIMKLCAAQGFRDFIVCLGHKGKVIKDYFLNFRFYTSDFMVDTKTGVVHFSKYDIDDWRVTLVDTGEFTNTAGRIRKIKSYLETQYEASPYFIVTYGDGVADIKLLSLVAHHLANNAPVTVTAVRPASKFGELDFIDDQVCSFSEKPQVSRGWINGGFIVCDRVVFDFIHNDSESFEREVLTILGNERRLGFYKHEGFWECVDTPKDLRYLNSLWESGNSPWKIWE